MQSEYAAIAEGMRKGTLPPAGPDTPASDWINHRFANSHLSTSGRSRPPVDLKCLAPGFGEQFDSALHSSISYSFGHCSRKQAAEHVYISEELCQHVETLGRGPPSYKIPSNMGPDGACKTVSTRAPTFRFGSDVKHSVDLREYKSAGICDGTHVATGLRQIRDTVHKRAN